MVIIDSYVFALSSRITQELARVWGTMERLGDGVMCALYDSEGASICSGARITQTGLLPFSDQLEMCTKCISVDEVFHGIGGGWNGKYS